jgi:hypothetical protein
MKRQVPHFLLTVLFLVLAAPALAHHSFPAEGKRVFETTEAWHDDVLRCMPLGLPRTFGSPYAMEIVDAGSHYLVVYE